MLGFPIRKSSDHSSVDSSPRLIAASYVLHRLLMPRHPPCALNNLTTKMLASTVQFSNNHPSDLTTNAAPDQATARGMTTDQSGEPRDLNTTSSNQQGRTARVLSGPNSAPNTPTQPRPVVPRARKLSTRRSTRGFQSASASSSTKASNQPLLHSSNAPLVLLR